MPPAAQKTKYSYRRVGPFSVSDCAYCDGDIKPLPFSLTPHRTKISKSQFITVRKKVAYVASGVVVICSWDGWAG